jgi:hypothetical protein
VSGLAWARLVEAGLSHVEHLADSDEHEQWIVVSPDGAALVRIERTASYFTAYVYRPGPRPSGGTSTMRDWVFDWQRVYGENVGELVDDVAAIAG